MKNLTNFMFKPSLLALAATLAACGGGGSGGTEPVAIEKQTTIKRDSYGRPHVYANDTFGLFFGMGYAVAEDRLFQWEMMKRVGRGTAAEVLGASYVAADRQARSEFDPQSLQDQIDQLPADEKDILLGYVAGYNQRLNEVLANQKQLLPIQFTEYGFLPTPLTPLDVVAVHVRTSAVNFSGGNGEISNLALLDALKVQHGNAVGATIFDQLRWKNDAKATPTIADPDMVPLAAAKPLFEQAKTWVASIFGRDRATGVTVAKRSLAPVSQELAEAELQNHVARYGGHGPDFFPRASNLWILSKGKTAEGTAIMHSGPEFGHGSPTNAYGIGLHGAGWDFVGSSSWGLPLSNWGASKDIGWAVTVSFGDTNDMFQIPSSTPMRKRTEVIKVKDAAAVTEEFFHTEKYGQVHSIDTAAGVAYANLRSWSGKEVDSLISWTLLARAKNWDEFLSVGKRQPLGMNWYYIDKSDNIGMAFFGHYPVKATGQDSRLPTPGDGLHDWQGILPFAKNPKVINPQSGFIANWNNKIQTDWGNSDTWFWGQMDHVDVPHNILNGKATFTHDEVKDLNRISAFKDANLDYFRPIIETAFAAYAGDPTTKAAADTIVAWDGMAVDNDSDGHYDAPAQTILHAWLAKMQETVLKDDIPAAYWSQYSRTSRTSPTMGTKVLLNALQGAAAGVPQTYDMFNGVDKTSTVRAAMESVVASLTAKNPSMSAWLTPVDRHTFSTTNFGLPMNSPTRTESLPVRMSRGTSNHVMTFPNGKTHYSDVIAPGQSAFIGPDGKKSPHYADQLDLYKNFQLKQGLLDPSAVDADAKSVLTISYQR